MPSNTINKNIFSYTIAPYSAYQFVFTASTGVNESKVQSSKIKVEIAPNPIDNHIANISYQLKVKSHVTLKIIDFTGREVDTVTDGVREKGEYKIISDAEKLGSGIYFLNMMTEDETKFVKFIKL